MPISAPQQRESACANVSYAELVAVRLLRWCVTAYSEPLPGSESASGKLAELRFDFRFGWLFG